MFTRMVMVALSLNVSCALFVGSAQADDKAQRDRKAKAALALAGAKEVAPAPAKALLDYDDAVKLAKEKAEPMIVFYQGAPRKDCPKGAVCAKASLLPGYAKACVIIGYPADGSLLVSDKLPADATVAEIKAAFDKAAVKAKEANPPEQSADEWFITADAFEVDPPKAVLPPKLPVCPPTGCPGGVCGPNGCPCGSACPCAGVAAGVINARAAAAITGFGRPHLFGGHVRGFVQRVAGRLFHRR